MEQEPSWGADVFYRNQIKQPLNIILSQYNAGHITTSDLIKILPSHLT
jgi:hypothetical protein